MLGLLNPESSKYSGHLCPVNMIEPQILLGDSVVATGISQKLVVRQNY